MEQRIVKLQIANEYIMGAGVSIGAVGSHDDVLLEMDFRSSAQWANTTRRAIFSNALGENRTPIILTTNLLAEGHTDVYLVPVPAEAKDVAGECFLTVEGYIGEGENEILRVVTEEATFRVLPSKLYSNENTHITPNEAEQLQAEIDAIKDDILLAAKAANSEENAKKYAWEAEASKKNAQLAAQEAAESAQNALASKNATSNSAAEAKQSKDMAEEYARQAAQVVLGQIPDGSLTKAKMAPEVQQLLVGENLLRNSYWANADAIIDQRGGYVVPPGKEYFDSATGYTKIGDTTTYYTVVRRNEVGVNYIVISGTEYAVRPEDAVRGYVGAGYTIDGWCILGANTVVLVKDNEIWVGKNDENGDNGRIFQPIESPKHLAGKTHMASLMLNNDENFSASIVMVYSNADLKIMNFSSASGAVVSTELTFPEGTPVANTGLNNRFQISVSSGWVKLKAAKLELGSVQTIAHQENGKWVLNEIPDKNEELLKCCISTADPADDHANNKKTPSAINAVNKAGDTMTGGLKISQSSYPRLDLISADANFDGRVMVGDKNVQIISRAVMDDDTNRRSIIIRNNNSTAKLTEALQLQDVNNNVSKFYDILHTGNKPSGSYTGNGSSWHPITNVIGNGVIVWSSQGVALITPNGGIARESGNNTIIGLGGSVCTFSSGDLWVAAQTDANASMIALVNKATVTYNYQVL